jgi:hypothetical protein
MKRFGCLLVVAAIMISSGGVASAISDKDYEYLFYDRDSGNSEACLGGDINSPAPTSLTGENNEEKSWNYFKARGLSDIAAAGAMGNMQQENGSFDPFLVEGGDRNRAPVNTPEKKEGFGIIQWTPGLDVYNEVKDMTEDEALLHELNKLWGRGNDSFSNFWEELNKETSVGNWKDSIPPARPSGQFWGKFTSGSKEVNYYQGYGSAYFFHAVIERSGDTNKGLDDEGIPKGGGNILRRPYNAENFMKKYGDGSSSCGDAANNGDIASVAEQYGNRGGKYTFGGCTTKDCAKKFLADDGKDTGIDCGAFVAAVIYKATGKHKYASSGSIHSNPTAYGYEKIGRAEPGAVAWRSGHVAIVIKVYGDKYDVAHAANTKHGIIITKNDKFTEFYRWKGQEK